MPPSDKTIFRSGYFCSLPENSQSVVEFARLRLMLTACTPKGASGDVFGLTEDDPMCVHNGIFVSFTTAKKSSHAPEWMDGNPNGCRFSEKAMALAPLPAHRSVSSTAKRVSHNGMMTIGM